MNSHRSPVTSHQIISGVLIVLLMGGCANVKEACRGIAGTSTKILEEGADKAIVKEYAMDLITCKRKARASLIADASYIYAEDQQKQLIAVYVSQTDTTPVGLFFKEKDKTTTRILFSSPSTYAKELIAERVDKALTKK